MADFGSFLVKEELNAAHAERFLTFMDRFNAEVFLDLKKHLSEEWKKAATELSKSYPISIEIAQEATLKNPKATIVIELATSQEKITTSRSATSIEVSPSVKLPLLYSTDERALFIKRLLVAGVKACKKTVHDWSEIFKYEKNGRITSWFKIIEDLDEVRLQLALNEGVEETYKTLYAIRVEHGKSGSKTKDFDRLYLISLA